MCGSAYFTLSDKQFYVNLDRLLGAKGYSAPPPPPKKKILGGPAPPVGKSPKFACRESTVSLYPSTETYHANTPMK